jgi:hypothetical protein
VDTEDGPLRTETRLSLLVIYYRRVIKAVCTVELIAYRQVVRMRTEFNWLRLGTGVRIP